MKKVLGNAANPTNSAISWNRFGRENLQDRDFPFGFWFFLVQKLTQTKLSRRWSDRSIIGFINKDGAAEKLRGFPPGTFILRYGDKTYNNNEAGISIVYVDANLIIQHRTPMGISDLNRKSLEVCVANSSKLAFLYPDIPKATVFGPPSIHGKFYYLV